MASTNNNNGTPTFERRLRGEPINYSLCITMGEVRHHIGLTHTDQFLGMKRAERHAVLEKLKGPKDHDADRPWTYPWALCHCPAYESYIRSIMDIPKPSIVHKYYLGDLEMALGFRCSYKVDGTIKKEGFLKMRLACQLGLTWGSQLLDKDMPEAVQEAYFAAIGVKVGDEEEEEDYDFEVGDVSTP